MDIPLLLTQYDPLDLPGSEPDPLGFAGAQLALADNLLPGLGERAVRPRYYSLICAGLLLGEQGPESLRRATLMRLERFWALANVFVAGEERDPPLDVTHLRGADYARVRASNLLERNLDRTTAEFRLLARQEACGALGVYGESAMALGLLDGSLSLTERGQRLGQAFISGTELPEELIVASLDPEQLVSISELWKWGMRAHVSGTPAEAEAEALVEALNADPRRALTAALLARFPQQEAGEPELQRLARIARELPRSPEGRELMEPILAILAFEESYRLCRLAFERLVWFSRHAPGPGKPLADFTGDTVMELVVEKLPAAAAFLHRIVNGLKSPGLKANISLLLQIVQFVDAAGAADRGEKLARTVAQRHRELGMGRWTWIEVSPGGHVRPTIPLSRGLGYEATHPAHIPASDWRLKAADALAAARKAA